MDHLSIKFIRKYKAETALNTLLNADDLVILQETQITLQQSVSTLANMKRNTICVFPLLKRMWWHLRKPYTVENSNIHHGAQVPYFQDLDCDITYEFDEMIDINTHWETDKSL